MSSDLKIFLTKKFTFITYQIIYRIFRLGVMNKILLYFILFCLLPLNSYSGNKIIVGINKNYPPHEYIEKDKPCGFNVDILKAVAEKTDLQIKFFPVDENESYSLLLSGKIDVLATSAYKERLQYFDFTENTILDLSLAIFVKENVYSITKVEDLGHHTVVVEKKDVSHEYLKKVKNAIIITVANQKEAMKLLSTDQVFAYFGNKYTGLYLVQKNKLYNIKIIGNTIPIQPRILAVKKGNAKLKDLLDKGIAIIKEKGIYSDIYNKWFGYSFHAEKSKRLAYRVVLIICIILVLVIFFILVWNRRLGSIIQAKVKGIEIKEKKYSNLVHNINNGIICVDQDNKIILINPGMLEILNMEEKDLLLKNLNDISGLNDIKENILKIVEDLRTGQKNIWRNLDIKIKDNVVIFNITGFKFIDENYSQVITLVFTDISAHERLKEQLYQSQKMEAIGRLVDGISHDFNNTLTGIISSIEFIRSSKYLDKDIKAEVDLIEKFSDRAKELTNKLLVFSEKQGHHPEIVDLNDLLLNIQNILKRITKENIEINLHLSDSLEYIQIDPSQLEHILINLVINAIDAMPDGGEILIKTKNIIFNSDNYKNNVEIKAKEYVLLEFSDNGTGMDQETLNHVFEPFFSAKDKGNGLGLFMVYGIVQQNKGFIEVKTKKEEGTTFKIYFPAKMEKEVKKQIRYQKESYQKIKIKGKHIFIIEDDEELRELLYIYLSKLGAKVYEFGTGKEVLAKLNEFKKTSTIRKKIDLLLMDVILPDGNGKELFEKYKKIFPDLKVIFMSGYSQDIIMNIGLDKNQFNFIQKPFSLIDLGKVLKLVL